MMGSSSRSSVNRLVLSFFSLLLSTPSNGLLLVRNSIEPISRTFLQKTWHPHHIPASTPPTVGAGLLYQGLNNNNDNTASDPTQDDEKDDSSSNGEQSRQDNPLGLNLDGDLPLSSSSSSWSSSLSSSSSSKKLGIDVGSLLAPLSEKEAAELRAAASEVVNDAVAAGIDEIETIRSKMRLEVEERRKAMEKESEQIAKEASDALMNRIDALTDELLANTKLTRTSTKLAAMADQALEGQGRGIDMGTWGTLGGATVLAGSQRFSSSSSSSTLGGSSSLKSSSSGLSGSSSSSSSSSYSQSNARSRLLIVANTKDDSFAKQLIDPLFKELQQVLPALEFETIAPTATWPLGGNDAAAVLLFLTSLSDASTVRNGLERLLRKTIQPLAGTGSTGSTGSALSQPPTQIVAISSTGTARTNQMPYSMQNLWNGGQLEKRKQMEEAVQTMVEQKYDKTQPPYLDYTICKLGEIKSSGKESFSLAPGDVLDGTMDVDSAVAVLTQAIALQPAARNATFCTVGRINHATPLTQQDWDDLFLQLDGPQLWRQDLLTSTNNQSTMAADFARLVEYLEEWSQLDETSKGLTTPIRIEQTLPPTRPLGVVQQYAIQFLFQPTATGSRYMSRDDERQLERERQSTSSGSGTSSSMPPPQKRKATSEGGLEIRVEITQERKDKPSKLRVRVRRCNYAPGVIIKELTEETLMSRIKKTIDVWLKQ